MRILVLPRDANPYQGLLYEEMTNLGARITYLGGLTPSWTLNVLLLPFEVMVRRLAGARLIHIHWVFFFAPPLTARTSAGRWAMQLWFQAWLRICRSIGIRLVWTAHNVLPHEPVFADDVSARRCLVTSSDLVIAHSQSTLDQLAGLGMTASKVAIIRHGPVGQVPPAEALRVPGTGDGPRHFLFIGHVKEYKGVDDLLTAYMTLLPDVTAHLTVAGECTDPELRSRLNATAGTAGTSITLRLQRLQEDEIARLLSAADAVVLPFRRVTTSGSAMLALTYGRPLIVPNLPGFGDLPDGATLRYKDGPAGLVSAMKSAARADGAELAAMSRVARSYACGTPWGEIAQRTMLEMREVLNGNVTCHLDSEGPDRTATSNLR
jgi:glycosyltransferase involved in cell wall biosynthesis